MGETGTLTSTLLQELVESVRWLEEGVRNRQARLESARSALVDHGGFKPTEVNDDIAPRIIELVSRRNRTAFNYHCILQDCAAAVDPEVWPELARKLEEALSDELCPPQCGHLKEALAELGKIQAVDIVFDGPPGPEAGRFVEVEDEKRQSVHVGEWLKRNDGYWALRLMVQKREVLGRGTASEESGDAGDTVGRDGGTLGAGQAEGRDEGSG